MYHLKNKDIIIFSKEEKEQAKNISTIDYLEKNYGFHFKPSGTMYRCVEHDSLVVRSDCRGWHWNSRGFGGSDVIEFIRKNENKSYEDALKSVLGVSSTDVVGRETPYVLARSNVDDNKQKELILPPKCDGKFKRVFAYLNQTRCIDSMIITTLMHKNYLYEDSRHNCVFVGYNKIGLPTYATVRTTQTETKYRKEAMGSDKSNGFYLKGYNKEKLFVFESPIDLLSHCCLANLQANSNKAWLNNTRLSLGGVSDRALQRFVKDYPEVKTIILCLDNDLAGKQACDKIKAEFRQKGYEVILAPPKNKDYNDDLKELVNAPKKVKQTRI